ncbi:MAG: hypothetical protein AB7E34_11190 [Acidaminococcaceae bacterium]
MKTFKLIFSAFLIMVMFNSTGVADEKKVPHGFTIAVEITNFPQSSYTIDATLTIKSNDGAFDDVVRNITLTPYVLNEFHVKIASGTYTGVITALVNYNHDGCSYQGSSSLQGTFNPNHGYTLPIIDSHSVLTCF